VKWATLAVVAGSTLAAAGTPSVTRLVMKQADGTNLHIANGAGAMHWQDDITVGIDLEPNSVAVTSIGLRRKSDLDARGAHNKVTVDETTWKTKWYGTWHVKGDTLELQLVLSDDQCTHQLTETGFAPETRACSPAAKRARVTCTTAQVALESTDAKPAHTVDAWSCSPATDTDQLGESPSSWMLGKTECIQRYGGHMSPFSYGTCTASPT
jgi:hypothetical protein